MRGGTVRALASRHHPRLRLKTYLRSTNSARVVCWAF